jgi:hypothetical protein
MPKESHKLGRVGPLAKRLGVVLRIGAAAHAGLDARALGHGAVLRAGTLGGTSMVRAGPACRNFDLETRFEFVLASYTLPAYDS